MNFSSIIIKAIAKRITDTTGNRVLIGDEIAAERNPQQWLSFRVEHLDTVFNLDEASKLYHKQSIQQHASVSAVLSVASSDRRSPLKPIQVLEGLLADLNGHRLFYECEAINVVRIESRTIEEGLTESFAEFRVGGIRVIDGKAILNEV